VSNCVPAVGSSAPATAQQVRGYIDALRVAREQRAAHAARAAARAQSLVTPVPAPGAVLELSPQSTTLTFPLSDPGADIFTAAFTPVGARLTARQAHGDINVVAPADVSVIGVRADDPTSATLYMESPNLQHIGVPATLVVVITFHGVGGLSGATIELPRVTQTLELTQPALSIGGVTYAQSARREGDVVARVASGARLTHIDITTRWYRQDGVELPSGYPSALRGWKSAAQLPNYGIEPPPRPVITPVATAYQTNPRAPYGYSWQTCRPAGWPIDGPHVATRESSSAFLELAIEQAVQLLSVKYPPLAAVPNFEAEATAIVDAVAIKEGNGRLWLPQNGFDIRPRQGDGLTTRNRLDEGPPRRFKWHVVDSAYRSPGSSEIVSPIGPFQMTVDTFRGEYDRRVRDGTFVGPEHAVGRYADKWLWDAPVEYQLLLPALKLIEETYVPTSPAVLGGRLFPPIYRALAIYAVNALNSVGRNFIAEAVLAVNALPVTATSTELHIACKTVWDSGTGTVGTWAYFQGFKPKHANMIAGIGQKLALSGSALPATHPALFQVPPGGLPAPRARR